MPLEIKDLRPSDYPTIERLAATGMHFDWYMDSSLLLKLYSRYFWYSELARATQIIAAHDGDAFAGVLLAAIEGERPARPSWRRSLYVKVFEAAQALFSREGAGAYQAANKELFARAYPHGRPDGEIGFLLANHELGVKGIGSVLLAELERREPGKRLFLYTDNACTYQFYEHRGFTRAAEQDIVVRMSAEKAVDLSCYLYEKTMGSTAGAERR